MLAHVKTLLANPLAGYLTRPRTRLHPEPVSTSPPLPQLMYFSEALMVGQWMRRNRQSHLHVHLASQAASVGLFVHRVFRCGYSLTVHGPDEFYDAKSFYLAHKIAAADFIVCISSYARSQLMYLSPSKYWKQVPRLPPRHRSASLLAAPTTRLQQILAQ